MKFLKLTLSACMLLSLSFLSCEKETETVENEVKPQEEINFISAQEQGDNENIDVDLLVRGEYAINAQDRTGCATINSLQKITHPSIPSLINLNVQYDVDNPTQVVQIKHWVNTGSGYSYFGQDNIPSSYTVCTNKSVNMSTGHIPSGTIISWARLWDAGAGTFCGSSQIHTWTK